MILKSVALVLLCLAAAAIFPAYRRWQLLNLDLLNHILPGCFGHLADYLDNAEENEPGPEFWTLSEGVRGILCRLWRMALVVRLLQHQVHAGLCSKEEARYVWEKSRQQVFFSLLAIGEAAVCLFWHELPHACGLFALRCHHQLTYRTVNLCSNEEDGMELQRLL